LNEVSPAMFVFLLVMTSHQSLGAAESASETFRQGVTTILYLPAAGVRSISQNLIQFSRFLCVVGYYCEAVPGEGGEGGESASLPLNKQHESTVSRDSAVGIATGYWLDD
jgi:hypothetical protein